MKSAILAIALGSVAGPMGAPDPTALASPRDPVTPESRVWITGSSNLRGFTCRAIGVSGTVDLQANATRRLMFSGENVSNAPSLRIPVALLDCGVSTMNRHLREALRADVYDAIEFHLDSYDVHSGESLTARVAGRLRIAGTERAIVATAAIEADTSGKLHVRGAHGVRMSDFGVQPPRRFAGLLRVRDSIVVYFDIVPARGVGAVDIVERTSRGATARILRRETALRLLSDDDDVVHGVFMCATAVEWPPPGEPAGAPRAPRVPSITSRRPESRPV